MERSNIDKAIGFGKSHNQAENNRENEKFSAEQWFNDQLVKLANEFYARVIRQAIRPELLTYTEQESRWTHKKTRTPKTYGWYFYDSTIGVSISHRQSRIRSNTDNEDLYVTDNGELCTYGPLYEDESGMFMSGSTDIPTNDWRMRHYIGFKPRLENMQNLDCFKRPSRQWV